MNMRQFLINTEVYTACDVEHAACDYTEKLWQADPSDPEKINNLVTVIDLETDYQYLIQVKAVIDVCFYASKIELLQKEKR